MTVELLFKNYKKPIHLLIDKNSKVVLVFVRNNAGLKKLSKFCLNRQLTHLPFLPVMCLVKYVLNCEQHISFFLFRFGLTVTGLESVYCIIFLKQSFGLVGEVRQFRMCSIVARSNAN
jgi:hypothetical protein